MDRAQQTEMANSFLARHRAAPVAAECVGCIERTTLRRCRVRCAGDNQRGRCLGVGISRWRIRSLGGGGGCDRAYRAVRASTGTADTEAGYGATPAEVGAHVAEIIQAGVIGINLEDGLHGPIRSIEDAAARLRAAREAASKEGVPIVLNARCDVFQLQHGEESTRFASTVARCKTYLAAGADCVYPFGLRDPATIAAFVKAVGGPVNITGRPGMPNAAAFERMGVARITIASAPTLMAMSTIQKLATELRAPAVLRC